MKRFLKRNSIPSQNLPVSPTDTLKKVKSVERVKKKYVIINEKINKSVQGDSGLSLSSSAVCDKSNTAEDSIEEPMTVDAFLEQANISEIQTDNIALLHKADKATQVQHQIMNKTYCCVPQCKSYGMKDPTLSFHQFPCSSEQFEIIRRQEWIRVLRIGKEVTKRMKVCSKHFKSTDYFLPSKGIKHYLKRTVIPSQNLPSSPADTVEKMEKKMNLIQKRKQRKKNESVQCDFGQNLSSSAVCDKSNVTEDSDIEEPMTADTFLELGNVSEIQTDNIALLHKDNKATQVTSGDLETKLSRSKLSVNQLNLKEILYAHGFSHAVLLRTTTLKGLKINTLKN